jgi:hypothetical protein
MVNNQYYMVSPLVQPSFSTNHHTLSQQVVEKVAENIVSQDLFISEKG